MGASASALIDELHTSAQLSDDFAADRKLHALRDAGADLDPWLAERLELGQ
jgi:hypothetical protein